MDCNDTEVLQRIAAGPESASEVARDLFFALFEQIEAVIRRRLRWYGLAYDETADHYNSVLDLVYQRIFAPAALPAATAGFDAARGRLDAWLLQRVAFVVRDWLRARPVVPSVGSVPDVPEVAAAQGDAAESAAASADQLLGEALAAMTPLQRACAVLRLLPVRMPTDEDLAVVAEVSGRSAAQLRELLSQAAMPWRELEHNQQAQELLTALAAWHLRRATEERKLHYFQSELRRGGADDEALQALAVRAGQCTQAEIQKWFASPQKDGMSRHEARCRRQLALAFWRLQRCRQRIESLLRKLAALRAVPLLEHAEIARILQATPKQVNACLHRVRNGMAAVFERNAEA